MGSLQTRPPQEDADVKAESPSTAAPLFETMPSKGLQFTLKAKPGNPRALGDTQELSADSSKAVGQECTVSCCVQTVNENEAVDLLSTPQVPVPCIPLSDTFMNQVTLLLQPEKRCPSTRKACRNYRKTRSCIYSASCNERRRQQVRS